ncbi:MAG: LysR family transcriptional regulator [Roseovarius sp.]|nr:LysR family transcriptional regulator [Roseovarius sp.]
MDLRQLRAFSAVMDSGLVSKAAEEIGVTQPAVSKIIKGLEEEFGVVLFERRKGRLVPTPEAKYLKNVARSLLDQINDVQRHLKDYGNLRVGDLRVLSIPGPTLFFLPALISRFVGDHSAVTVSIMSWPTPNVVNWISNHQTGVGLAEWYTEDPFINVETFHLPVSCAMAADHPLAKKHVITPEDLRDTELASINPDHPLHKQIEKRFHDADCTMDVRLYSDLFVPQFTLIRDTRLVGFVDAINIRNYQAFVSASSEIVFKKFSPEVFLDISLITPAFSPLSELEKAFAKHLENELRLICRRE